MPNNEIEARDPNDPYPVRPEDILSNLKGWSFTVSSYHINEKEAKILIDILEEYLEDRAILRTMYEGNNEKGEEQ